MRRARCGRHRPAAGSPRRLRSCLPRPTSSSSSSSPSPAPSSAATGASWGEGEGRSRCPPESTAGGAPPRARRRPGAVSFLRLEARGAVPGLVLRGRTGRTPPHAVQCLSTAAEFRSLISCIYPQFIDDNNNSTPCWSGQASFRCPAAGRSCGRSRTGLGQRIVLCCAFAKSIDRKSSHPEKKSIEQSGDVQSDHHSNT